MEVSIRGVEARLSTDPGRSGPPISTLRPSCWTVYAECMCTVSVEFVAEGWQIASGFSFEFLRFDARTEGSIAATGR